MNDNMYILCPSSYNFYFKTLNKTFDIDIAQKEKIIINTESKDNTIEISLPRLPVDFEKTLKKESPRVIKRIIFYKNGDGEDCSITEIIYPSSVKLEYCVSNSEMASIHLIITY